MAILKRRTESQKFISCTDTAFAKIDRALAESYLETRNFDSIAGALESTGEMPTVFHVRPLTTDAEWLLDSKSAPAAREFVRRHVEAVSGIDLAFEDYEGLRCLTKDGVNELPLTVVVELHTFIQESQSRAGRELDFFTQPDTWRDVRRSIELSTRRAKIRS